MESTKVAGGEISTAHFIDGKRVASKRTFANCSPIDGKHLADVSAGGASEIDSAVAAARRAFPKWAALGPDRRHRVLKKFAQTILDHAKELSAVETVDNGSLLMGNLARGCKSRALRSCRSRGPDHAVERPLHAHDVEGWARARRGRHGSRQTARV